MPPGLVLATTTTRAVDQSGATQNVLYWGGRTRTLCASAGVRVKQSACVGLRVADRS